MSERFYRAFEDKFRGSRELVQSRLLVYRPFLEILKSIDREACAIDLGCGRGEWLELLRDCGFQARGIDLDEGMLSVSRHLGLQVTCGDALSTLRDLPDDSQLLVSGFHIAEHLLFTELQELVEQAHRVLKPGGVLILETPNPENFSVATVNFYLDPTHQRPIPPQLLSFLPEYYGFLRVQVWRLQENQNLVTKTQIGLRDVWQGVSPDYAVIAQKSATADVLEKTEEFFSSERGLNIDTLIDRFDQRLNVLTQRGDSWPGLAPFQWLTRCLAWIFKK